MSGLIVDEIKLLNRNGIPVMRKISMAEAQNIIRRIGEELTLPVPPVRAMRSKQFAGWYSWDDETIYLNYTSGQLRSERFRGVTLSTVLHELAHYFEHQTGRRQRFQHGADFYETLDFVHRSFKRCFRRVHSEKKKFL